MTKDLLTESLITHHSGTRPANLRIRDSQTIF